MWFRMSIKISFLLRDFMMRSIIFLFAPRGCYAIFGVNHYHGWKLSIFLCVMFHNNGCKSLLWNNCGQNVLLESIICAIPEPFFSRQLSTIAKQIIENNNWSSPRVSQFGSSWPSLMHFSHQRRLVLWFQ